VHPDLTVAPRTVKVDPAGLGEVEWSWDSDETPRVRLEAQYEQLTSGAQFDVIVSPNLDSPKVSFSALIRVAKHDSFRLRMGYIGGIAANVSRELAELASVSPPPSPLTEAKEVLTVDPFAAQALAECMVLDGKPITDWETLHEKYTEGLQPGQIAKRHGVSADSLKNRLQKAEGQFSPSQLLLLLHYHFHLECSEIARMHGLSDVTMTGRIEEACRERSRSSGVLYWREFDDLSYKEIAARLQISECDARQRHRRAKEWLKGSWLRRQRQRAAGRDQ